MKLETIPQVRKRCLGRRNSRLGSRRKVSEQKDKEFFSGEVRSPQVGQQKRRCHRVFEQAKWHNVGQGRKTTLIPALGIDWSKIRRYWEANQSDNESKT